MATVASWSLISDDELTDEVRRRGGLGHIEAQFLTDDQLRDEYERRGMHRGIAFDDRRQPRVLERGPGIATKRPDNSIPHLPEDLLCEDA